MKSMAKNEAGADGRPANSGTSASSINGLEKRCGRSGAVEAQGEFSAAPAPGSIAAYSLELETPLSPADRRKVMDVLDRLSRADAAIDQMTAALLSAYCPAGGYTSQPKDEEPTVENCLKAGNCGCTLGAAVGSNS